MAVIVGRNEEQAILEGALQSERPEFLAVYGRRRVGKTYLVRNTFEHTPQVTFFYVTGIKDGTMTEQLSNFAEALVEAFLLPETPLVPPANWRAAFKILTNYITASKKMRVVLFFDEFPWMATPNSRLLQMLEHYWNHYWSRDPRIKLIVCGSSSSWILRNIVNNRGGLYNRVTENIHLEPFSLNQTKKYLKHEKVDLPDFMIIHLYMVLGGIPYYLSKVKPGLSAIQVVESLAFKKNSFLFNEFQNLYATLFDVSGGHIELARIIAEHRYGIGQEDLAYKAVHASSGGSLVRKLAELEDAGFIQRFKPFLSKKKGIFYKMIDEYSLFYFTWIEPNKEAILNRGMPKGYLAKIQHSPAWHAWAGYSFETICYKHIPQISDALKLDPGALAYAWKLSTKKSSGEQGAQIDLLFDRDDKAITLCEIKYTDKPFMINKGYAEELSRKRDIFKQHTKTDKHIFLACISANGIKKNAYSQTLLSGLVTSQDLFKDGAS